jgi:hypothetical protein
MILLFIGLPQVQEGFAAFERREGVWFHAQRFAKIARRKAMNQPNEILSVT